jgi:hypothetical protein
MNTEALQPPVPVFLAVHHPVKMFRTSYASLYQGRVEEALSPYTERRLLEELFRPKDFAFIPVLGNAGTGKSHLVRWLSLNVPRAENRHVLLIPKIDTNLWDVLYRMLHVPGVKGNPEFDEYRATLRKTERELQSEEHAREKLLYSLAIACGKNGPHKMQGLNSFQSDLVEHLPDLLTDPHFKEHWLRNDGVFARLVRHVVRKNQEVERLEEKRGFQVGDLPLRASDVGRASKKVQKFFGRLIGLAQVQTEAVDWLNRHLSTAITELLEISGEALLRLMLDVRASLAHEGLELVLLIEDFAKLQGIDLQLLEAIIAKPVQEGRAPLCALRTVLACTKGYFGDLPDTVRSRGDFYVTLDLDPDHAETSVSPGEVESFVARYLNATRLSEEELDRWHQSEAEKGLVEPPPNACLRCEFREPCHAGFGEKEGVGLYPFTSTAIARMTERMSPKGFNPRLVLKDVLKPILSSYSTELRDGRFPPPALVDHFKGPGLSAVVKSELSRVDPNPLTKGRRLALLDLWSNGARVIDLDPRIHEAFSLPPIGTAETSPPPVPAGDRREGSDRLTSTKHPLRSGQDELPAQVQGLIELLDAWSNGGTLPQDEVQTLRGLVFDAVRDRMNWDAELLVEGFFCGPSRPFKRTSVNFVRQTRQQAQAEIELRIPLDPSAADAFTYAAHALQGLVLAKHFKSWNYRHGIHAGSVYLRRFATELDRWTEHVLDQIRSPANGGTAWDPALAAAELLSVGARMANRPPANRVTLESQINALFQNLESISFQHRATTWVALFSAIREAQAKLTEILLSHAACTKGGSRRVQMLDTSRLAEALRSFRKESKPNEEMPSESWELYAPIRKVREKVDSLLERAIAEERERLLAWYDRVRPEFGPDGSADALSEAVRSAAEAARDSLGFEGPSYERILASLEGLGARQLSTCFEAMKRLNDESSDVNVFNELGRDHSEVMDAVDGILTQTAQFLDRYEARVEADITQLDSTGEVESIRSEIGSFLDMLDTVLGQIGGGGG